MRNCLEIEILSQVLCITAWINFASVRVRKAAFYKICFWFGKKMNNACENLVITLFKYNTPV